MSTIQNENGEMEYSIIFTDIEVPSSHGSPLNNSYFKALESAYNVIFEANLVNQTVECLFGRDTSDLGKLADVHMTIQSAIQFWTNNYIIPEDRKQMLQYLQLIATPKAVGQAERPLQAEFKILWEDQHIYSFIGVAVQLDHNSILFCCRDTSKVEFSGYQAREIHALKKLHHSFDRYYVRDKNSLGAIVMEDKSDNYYELIYASPCVIDFFHMREDQYINHLENGFTPDEISVYTAKIGLADLDTLLKQRQVLAETPDHTKLNLSCQYLSESVFEIIICKENVPSVNAGIPQKGVFARTFGFFDLFVNGTPVVFSSKKEKELMALLIDRNGGTLSSSEALSYLWEDELPDEKLKGRYRKLAMGLKRTLEKYGVENLLVSKNGVRSVDTSKLLCDYYELLAGNSEYVQSFHNSYMSDYTWSEHTLGTLWDFS